MRYLFARVNAMAGQCQQKHGGLLYVHLQFGEIFSELMPFLYVEPNIPNLHTTKSDLVPTGQFHSMKMATIGSVEYNESEGEQKQCRCLTA